MCRRPVHKLDAVLSIFPELRSAIALGTTSLTDTLTYASQKFSSVENVFPLDSGLALQNLELSSLSVV